MALHGQDGENQTLGRKADEAVSDPEKSGSVVALLKGRLRQSESVHDLYQELVLRELRMIRIGIGLLAEEDLERLLED